MTTPVSAATRASAMKPIAARDPRVVIRGNERVLRARLSDAQFFFMEDQKVPFAQRLEGLKKVVYHSRLGTSYEKVMRVSGLADFLAQRIDPSLLETVKRAALLCKGDLITGMVGEFPSLQGVMGLVYARLSGEKEEVALAIYEHYLPTAAGGGLPTSQPGAILSLSDKLDTITGCFGVGLIPTGTADPYALRRQTLGIINIILDKRSLSLSELIEKSLSIGLTSQFFQFGFDGEPGFRQQVADVRQVVDLLGDGRFECFNACASGGGGFEDTDDVGIFLLQACTINIKRMLARDLSRRGTWDQKA